MLPVFPFAIKFVNFEKKYSTTITRKRSKCYQTPEKLFSSLWFWWLICKTYLMSKICGKIDLPVKINWSGKMPLHGSCRLQVIPQKVSPHDICGIEGKESDKSTVWNFCTHSPGAIFAGKPLVSWEMLVDFSVRLGVLYNSQLVLEWLRSLL